MFITNGSVQAFFYVTISFKYDDKTLWKKFVLTVQF